MKNAYLNSVIISRLYPCTIQKKKNKKLNKNILLINQRKDEKKNYKLFLITVHTQYILFNLLKIKLEL